MTEKQKKKAHVSLETTEPMSFGSGFISGILSSILGIFGLGIVLSLRFPNYFTTEELTDFYSSNIFFVDLIVSPAEINTSPVDSTISPTLSVTPSA